MNVNMSKDRIQQLINAVGSMPQADDSSIESTDFNWNEPRYFNKEQIAKLDRFAQNVGIYLSDSFASFCRNEYEVEVKSIIQHYAGEFIVQENEGKKNDYYLLFGSGSGKEYGVLEIPEHTAILWSKQLLGDSDSNEEQEKQLSQLEESILYDLSSVLVNVLSNANNKIETSPSDNLVSGQFPLNIKGTEEVCRISFSIKNSDTKVQTEASFIIPCTRLEIVTGSNKQLHSESSGRDYSQLILSHLESTNVCLMAQIACSQLSFEEMMNLQVNDVIMLDKKIDEPIELIIDGRAFGYGWPAKSEGHYAIKIAAIEN